MRDGERTIFQYLSGTDQKVGPTLNLSTPPELLPVGHCWKLTGVDGRFADSFRRFPGFVRLNPKISADADTRTDGSQLPAATSTSAGVTFFKYASVQKGDTDFLLRGFVYRLAGVITFLHFDTQDKKWYRFSLGATTPVDRTMDVAVVGRNLVLSIEGIAPTTYRWVYNRKAVSGDLLTTGDLIGVTTGPTTHGQTTHATVLTAGAATGFLGGPTGAATYRSILRWYDPTRNLWEAASDVQTVSSTVSTADRAWEVTLTAAEVKTRVDAGYTKLYCYRTIESGGAFYLEQIVNFNPNPLGAGTDTDSITDTFIGHDAPGVSTYTIRLGGTSSNPNHQPNIAGGLRWSLGMNDEALAFQKSFDPVLDDTGKIPAGGILGAYGEMLLARADVTEADQGDTSATLRWSSLYSNTPENFPLDHVYKPAVVGHKILSLVEAGDYAYAIRDDSVFRIHRNGNFLALNELYKKVGGTGRYAVASVGQSLYVVTNVGFMHIDGTSGRQDMISAVERLITEPDTYWRQSLDKVHMAFDAELGALGVLNTEKEELYWLWFQNGVVTNLVEAPFLFGTEGPHPESGGADRSWWITNDGRIFYVNADRRADRQTMCGATGEDPVNGTTILPNGDGISEFIYTDWQGNTATPPPDCVGFYVHVLSGANRGVSRKISAVTALPTIVLESALPNTLIAGDKIAIAPVNYEIGLWPPRSNNTGPPDLFARTTISQMTARLKLKRGEITGWGTATTNKNPNLILTYKLWRDAHVRAREQDAPIHEDPGFMYANIQETGYSVLPGVACRASDVDFELHGLQIHGTLDATEADGTP